MSSFATAIDWIVCDLSNWCAESDAPLPKCERIVIDSLIKLRWRMVGAFARRLQLKRTSADDGQEKILCLSCRFSGRCLGFCYWSDQMQRPFDMWDNAHDGVGD